MITNAFDELKWRGLVFDHIEGVPELLAKEKVTIYNGFDADRRQPARRPHWSR